MVYLHKSAFQSHGYLSSANCHVDSRWVLKIAGFALHAFRTPDCKEQVNMTAFGNLAEAICIYNYIIITVIKYNNLSSPVLSSS